MEKNIYQRMLGIMSELDFIKKSDKKVNGQYSFVQHDDVTAALHPLFVKYGVYALPTIIRKDQVVDNTDITIKVTFINTDKPEDRFETESIGYGVDKQDKGPGKAYSYALKMLYLKVFCLESGVEDNEMSFSERTTPEKKKEMEEKIPTAEKLKERKESLKKPAPLL